MHLTYCRHVVSNCRIYVCGAKPSCSEGVCNAQGAPSKCCFIFEGEAHSCAAVLQVIACVVESLHQVFLSLEDPHGM
jgi:hypothetical protein